MTLVYSVICLNMFGLVGAHTCPHANFLTPAEPQCTLHVLKYGWAGDRDSLYIHPQSQFETLTIRCDNDSNLPKQ